MAFSSILSLLALSELDDTPFHIFGHHGKRSTGKKEEVRTQQPALRAIWLACSRLSRKDGVLPDRCEQIAKPLAWGCVHDMAMRELIAPEARKERKSKCTTEAGILSDLAGHACAAGEMDYELAQQVA